MHWDLSNSRLALTFRRLRSRYGFSAPRMAVRTHVPWYWRALSMIALLAISFALAGWIYDTGRRYAGFDHKESEQELSALRGKVLELEKELGQLRSVADASESNLQIERTAQQQLTRQVKSLEEENARLKEDMAVFENIALAEGKEGGVSINRLQVAPDVVPGQYQYRMLVVLQMGKKSHEFKGSYQLVVNLQQGGKNAMITFPDQGAPNPQQYAISLKYFRHFDGTFKISPYARIKSVEARLMQDGTLKASKKVML